MKDINTQSLTRESKRIVKQAVYGDGRESRVMRLDEVETDSELTEIELDNQAKI